MDWDKMYQNFEAERAQVEIAPESSFLPDPEMVAEKVPSGAEENRLFEAGGGAINNQGNIGDITGNFINNYSNTVGGAISMGSFTTGLGDLSNIIKIGNKKGVLPPF